MLPFGDVLAYTAHRIFLDLERGDLHSMSRIPPIEGIELSLDGDSGTVAMSTLFSVMAHRPELAQHSMQLLEAAMRTGTVDPKLKELLAVRVSQVNHCFY